MIVIRKIIDKIADARALDKVAAPMSTLVRHITEPRPLKNALSGTWLGHHLHPVLTDLPIGAWAMASALDLTAGRSSENASRRLVGFGVLAAVPTAVAGASDWSDSYGPEQRVGVVHAALNLLATSLQTASWITRSRGNTRTGRALSAAGLGCTLSAAYLGGHLTFTRGVGVNHTAFQPAVTDWTDVATLSDLTVNQPHASSAGGVPIVLVKSGDDAVHALSATCVHAGGPLDEGDIVDDDCIRCPWHGSTFRLSDGSPARGPAAEAQPTWEVKITDGRVRVRSAAL